ncbi:MAG: transketolase [Candidatus Firestonebacteria bacterium]|nr:transketolase [Candidatus Firestonebacteria bacterium]
MKQSITELKKSAWQIRLELIRMFGVGKPHHYGGTLSCAEIVAALYFHKMNFSKELLNAPERDRLIMSKGHTVPAQYAALAMLGVFPMEELKTIKRLGSRLQGHPDITKTPGIEAPTGSLGQGLSYANGIALAAKLDGLKFNIFVIVGDGELQEGQTWEAAMTTSQHCLGNLCVIVDRNVHQSQGCVSEIMDVEPLDKKWQAFGWDTVRIDGHNMEAVCKALDGFTGQGKRPLAIIADTIKGKGVKFMEDVYKFHNAALTEEQFKEAEKEILAGLQEVK